MGYKVDTHNDLYIIGRGYPVDSIITIVVETPLHNVYGISISNGGAAATHLPLVLGSRYNLRMNYSQTKAKAKRRGIPFLLDSQDFAFLVSKPCHYCGARESIGLDRINTKGPYSKENVVPACTFCNTLRGAIPWELWNDFLRGVNGWYVPDPDLLKPVEDRPFKSMWRGR